MEKPVHDLMELSGQIERITFANEENGYTVAKVRPAAGGGLVNVVGNLMDPAPGEILKMQGRWERHPEYGEQFRVITYRTAVPSTAAGIEKYLGSGLIKGIGPVMAGRVVKYFGTRTLEIIDTAPEKLTLVRGIGKKRIAVITQAWADHKEIREVMIFLQSHGVSSGFAAKIYKYYGDAAISVVRRNPYRLAADIFGIGFATADKIAEKLGFAKDSSARLKEGVLYVLHQISAEGHAYYPYGPLLDKCAQTLNVGTDLLTSPLAAIAGEGRIIIDALSDMPPGQRKADGAVYLAAFHRCETGIATHLKILAHTPEPIGEIDIPSVLSWVQARLSIRLAAEQAKAVAAAVKHRVMVVTGGPGTGKTTIIKAVLKVFKRQGLRLLLTAPTGRAAKRMQETTGRDASTIHRLLAFSFKKGGFLKNAQHPLSCDGVILDEASMVDTVLMYHLLSAIPPGARVIFVGDANQLPSVGPGNVLNDIIASGVVPVVRLTEIFRQAKESRIVVNAHQINAGIIPDLSPTREKTDFYFRRREDPQEVLTFILELVSDHLPRIFGFDPLNDIQVLTPMHRGPVGAENLNAVLQNALNPGPGGVVRGTRTYRINDKVMQIKNNYDREIFNGDIGIIKQINDEYRELIISFEGRDVLYDFMDLDEIVPAYAVSIHKAQGSEYPAVIIPVLTQHYMLLQRNLIYTAVTRGKKLVVLVGTPKALAIAVRNNKTARRYTHLKYRLRTLWENNTTFAAPPLPI